MPVEKICFSFTKACLKEKHQRDGAVGLEMWPCARAGAPRCVSVQPGHRVRAAGPGVSPGACHGPGVSLCAQGGPRSLCESFLGRCQSV